MIFEKQKMNSTSTDCSYIDTLYGRTAGGFSPRGNFIMEKHCDFNLMKSSKTQTDFMLSINKNT